MFEFSDHRKEIRFLKDVCDKDLAEMSYIRDTKYKNYTMVDKNGISLESPQVYPLNPAQRETNSKQNNYIKEIINNRNNGNRSP